MITIDNTHPSWQPLLAQALTELAPNYLEQLADDTTWLPGAVNIFNAFTLPLAQLRYILFGESPYPRQASANGYAFWDAAVNELWSNTGLSARVNRATSLRNIIKMLLVARGDLQPQDTSQQAIACLDKSAYVRTIGELFNNFQRQGILLLNATLVFRKNLVQKDATNWRPFIAKLLELLAQYKPDLELILLGKIAQIINTLPAAKSYRQFQAEHPFNHSFISNPNVLNFFRPLHLLDRHLYV
jgi:uracil-DNA glycosylase